MFPCRLGDTSPEVWSLFCITFCLSAGLHLKSAIKTLPHEWSNKEENFYKFSTRKISEQNKFTWLNKSPWLSLLQVLVPRHSSQVVFQTNTFGTVAKFHHIKSKLPLCPWNLQDLNVCHVHHIRVSLYLWDSNTPGNGLRRKLYVHETTEINKQNGQ